MKRDASLLRGVIDFSDGKITSESLSANFLRLHGSKLEWAKPIDGKIFQIVREFFTNTFEVPTATTLRDYFDRANDVEGSERLKDIEAAAIYVRKNYEHLLNQIIEDQNRVKMTLLLKDVNEITTKGLIVGDGKEKQKLSGVKDGLLYFNQKVHELIPPDNNARTRGNLRDDTVAGWDEYQVAKHNKDKVWGKFTGLNEIDKVCHGLKRGEMWVHAAFAGELKCLPGDARVFDHRENRLRTLAEMFEAKALPVVTALCHEGKEFRLTIAETSHLVQNGIREVYDLRLSSGRQIGATSNHKFFTPQGWCALEDLCIGDFVAVPRKTFGTNKAKLLTDPEVKVLGYLLGDGSFKDYISFTATNEAIRSDFVASLLEMGLREGPADYQTASFKILFGDRAPSVRISRSVGAGNSGMVSPVRALLDSMGLWGFGAADKRIPLKLWGLPDRQIALLLGALWSTDGSCHAEDHARADRASMCRRNDVTYASKSRQLCLDIQSLLLRLGIQSSVSAVRSTYKDEPYLFYCVRVTGNASKRKFTSEIRVIGKEDRFARLAERLPESSGRRIPSVFLPKDRKVTVESGLERYSNGVKLRPTVTIEEAQRFVTPSDDLLKNALDGDLDWERVEAISFRGMEMTYDLSVPNHHSFVANDIVTHNTTLATNWCYNLVTRYRTNVFYVSMEMPYEQIRRLIYVIHSGNKKWLMMGYKPLDYRKVRDGELTPEEEEFYQLVLKDFNENPEHCRFEVWCPDRDVSIDDVRVEAELLHKEMEVGLTVLDHGGLMKARKAHRDYTIELNSVLRDTKKFALHFNGGEGMPTVVLFQINRQGKDEADKTGGKYKMKALSYANECLAEGTLVRTSQGILPIQDVQRGMLVWSSTGWKPVLDVMAKGEKEVVLVQTSGGYALTATPDHLFRVVGLDGLEWVEAKDLAGRHILADLGPDTEISSIPEALPGLVFERYEKPNGEQGVPLVVPSTMTPDLAYLMGAYDGDGMKADEYRVGWTGNRDEVTLKGELQRRFKHCFGHDLAEVPSRSRLGSFDLIKWSKPLKRWFGAMGMDRSGQVSPYVLRASPSIQAAYLKGLWDTDGSINSQKQLTLNACLAKRPMIEQVLHMMWGLGIACSIHEDETRLRDRTFNRVTLTVTAQDAKKAFQQKIGFTEPYKAARLDDACAKRALVKTTWPIGRLYLKVFSKYASIVAFPRNCVTAARQARSGRLEVPHMAIVRMVELLGSQADPDLEVLRQILRCRPRQVVSVQIEQEKRQVYDLEVSGDHEFSAGGVLVHNCERSADYVTTTYLNEEFRANNTTIICNLKNRDNPLFNPFRASVDFASRRIFNYDETFSSGADMSADEGVDFVGGV